ncbi:MAG: hypothetical protein K6C35_04790 [Eubacterium sp.]|nr:hypothetical protein [Eubacterium sp.]SEG11940.1 hypothetical protein SAMN04487934_10841 [Eubacterium ruminantium]
MSIYDPNFDKDGEGEFVEEDFSQFMDSMDYVNKDGYYKTKKDFEEVDDFDDEDDYEDLTSEYESFEDLD